MNELINKPTQTPIEIVLGIDENGMTTARKLYEFLELNPSNYARWCKTNITENEFAEENVDYFPFVINEERYNPNPTTDFKLTASFAKKLSMTAKNKRGEQAREYFVRTEETLKQLTKPKCIEDVLIVSLQEMKAMRERLNAQDEKIESVETKLEGIKEVVALNPNDWRKETSALINKMALKAGGYEHIPAIREESYKLLEQRFAVLLNRRLTNIKKTMALNGATKSKLDKLNPLDAIAKSKQLIEGYVAIVKEMAIKYGVV